MGFSYRIPRADEIKASKLDVRVINHLLQNLTIHLEKGGSKWLGLAHHLTDRPLEQTRVDRALDSHKLAQLPPRPGATRFLREPDV
jgi:type II secretory pathway component PulK